MSANTRSSVSDRVRMFEQSSRASSETGSDSGGRTHPFNRSQIARRYAEAKLRASPRATAVITSPKVGPKAPSNHRYVAVMDKRADECETSGRSLHATPREGASGESTNGANPVSPGRRASRGGQFDKIYASKFQHFKMPSSSTIVEMTWPLQDPSEDVVPLSTADEKNFADSQEETQSSSSQDENREPASENDYFLSTTSPTSHVSVKSGEPLASPIISPASSRASSRVDRLRVARDKSLPLGRGLNFELKRNLEAASIVVQDEKASSVQSGSSRSSRSSLSNEELTSVARRAIQLSKVSAETRSSRLENSPLTQMLKYKRERKITVEGTPATATTRFHDGYGYEARSLGSSTITSYDGSKTSRDTDSKSSLRMTRADRVAALKRHNQMTFSSPGENASVGSRAPVQPTPEMSPPVFAYRQSPTISRRPYVVPMRTVGGNSESQERMPNFSTKYARAAAIGSPLPRSSPSPEPALQHRVFPNVPTSRAFRPDPFGNSPAKKILTPLTVQGSPHKFGGFRSEALHNYKNILEASRGRGTGSPSSSPSSRATSDPVSGDGSTGMSDPFSQLSGYASQARLSRTQRAKQLKASIGKTKIQNPIMEESELTQSSDSGSERRPSLETDRHPNPYFRSSRFSEEQLAESLKFLVASADAQIASSRIHDPTAHTDMVQENLAKNATTIVKQKAIHADVNSVSVKSIDSWAQYDEEDLFCDSATEDKSISPVESDDIIFENADNEDDDAQFDFDAFHGESAPREKTDEKEFTANFEAVGFESYSFPSDGDSAKKDNNLEQTSGLPDVQESDVERSVLLGENISSGESGTRSAASAPIRPRTFSNDGSKSAASNVSANIRSPRHGSPRHESGRGVPVGRLHSSSTDGSKSAIHGRAKLRSSSIESYGRASGNVSSGESVSQRVEPIPEDEPLDSSIYTQEETSSTPEGQFLLKEKTSTTDSASSESHAAKPDALRWWQRNYGKKASGVTNSVGRGAFSRKSKTKKTKGALAQTSETQYDQSNKSPENQIVALEEDEDEDVFSGLEEESRLPEKSIEHSDNEAERPSASSDESGIPVPSSMMKGVGLKRLVKKQPVHRKSREAEGVLVLLPPPPPPPVVPKTRAPSQRASPRRSGMLIEESGTIDRVTSDITTSLLAGKFGKQSGQPQQPQQRVQTIKEEIGEDEHEFLRPLDPRQSRDPIRASANEEDENSVVASVPQSLSGESLERGNPSRIDSSVFMNLACGIGEQLSHVCRVASDKTLGFYGNANSKIESGHCTSNARTDQTCQAPLAACTPKDVTYANDVNEDDEQIWNQWDFRDDQSANGDTQPSGPLPVDDESLNTARRKEHEERREQAHVRLMEHVKKAQGRSISALRNNKDLEPLKIYPGSPGTNLMSPTPKSIATEFSFQQLNVLASFSSTLKNKGIKILKVNRRNQWQLRFLTVSNDNNGGKFAGVAAIEQCPKALLWLKNFNARKTNPPSTNLRHGGLLFKNVVKVETTWRLPKDRPVPKKLKAEYPEFAGVTIDYKVDGVQRNVLLCFKNRADARSFCTAVTVIKEVVLRQEDFTSDESE